MDVAPPATTTHRRLLRVFLPVGIVIAMLAVIIAIAVYAYQSNRRDALALSDDLLQALDQRIATEVDDYLGTAADMVELAAKVLEGSTFLDVREHVLEPLAISALHGHQQLAIFSFADAQGNFLMLKRMSDGAVHTKIIEHRNGERQVRWIQRDADGQIKGVEEVPDDSYDPRVRPWYRGAVAARGLYWSDIYIFFTDQKPGVTVSLPLFSANDEVRTVLGVDIELEKLSAFLNGLEIGERGRAMIVDEKGRLVAYPEVERMLKEVDGKLETVFLEELREPVLERAFNQFRVEGHGWRELLVDGQRHISMASSLQSTLGRNWSILIVAPEEDFVGFVAQNNKTALLLSIGVLGLASLLAGLLVAQGLRADRNAQMVLDRQHRLEGQSQAFSEIASEATLFDVDDAHALTELSEKVCRTVGVRRVSFWRLVDDNETLLCDDAYDRENRTHTRGAQFKKTHLPELFAQLESADELIIDSAARDPRSRDLHRIYLSPLGCDALLSVPIVRDEQSIGAVWLEDEQSGAAKISATEAIVFARTIASMLALRYSVEHFSDGAGAARAPGAPEQSGNHHAAVAAIGGARDFEAPKHMRDTAIAGNRTEAFSQRLQEQSRKISAEVFPNTSVLLLMLTESLALAEPVKGGDAPLADHLVCSLQELSRTLGVEYVKIMSDEIVCAAGFDGDAHTNAQLIADVALSMQDKCARLFTDLDRRAEFRIGIDIGPALGSTLGRGHQVYNLWGDAVRMASFMAQTSEAGGIQVTQSFYHALRDRYLFKGRGTYYAAEVGELPTYLLSGRI